MPKDNSKNNQNMQEITVVGELKHEKNSPLPPIYKWKGQNERVSVYWSGPVLTLLQKDDLKHNVTVFELKSEKIKFNFKVGNDDLGYAIYDYLQNEWQEGRISKILDNDKYMISVANKMEKIINLLGKNNTRYLPEYKMSGNVCELVKGANELISDKNKELGSWKANIPLLIPEFYMGPGSYEEIDTRADKVIEFLKSGYYKDCTKNKKNVGAFKSFKRSVKKVFNKVTGREKVEDLYKDIKTGLGNLGKCTFLDYESTTENGELKDGELIKLINNLKDDLCNKINPTKTDSYLLYEIYLKLSKIVEYLSGQKNYNLKPRGVYTRGNGQLTISDANMKMILKQYGIIDPDYNLKEAAICRYVLEILPTLKRSHKSEIDEETVNKEKLGEVLKQYKKVIEKFKADIVNEITLIVPKNKKRLPNKVCNNAECLKENCEALAEHYKLKVFEEFCDAADLLKNLNKLYGELPSYFIDMPENFKNKLGGIREDSKRIAYAEYVLGELLKDEYKPKNKKDTGNNGEDEFVIIPKIGASGSDNKIIKGLDKLKQNQDVTYYLDGLGLIGANDKAWKKWNGYVKDKIKDLKSVIKEYYSKYSLDDRYLKEAEFISILYILSRSVERANNKRSLAEYLSDFGYKLTNGFFIPESIGDSEAVKHAAFELYKACDSFDLAMDKKKCIKILNCIITNRYDDIDTDTRKNLKILEKKIKSKLKAC